MSTLRAGTPFRAAGVWLIPVVRVWLQRHAHNGAFWAAGGREPVAVVIRDAEGLRAVDMKGAEVVLDTLLVDVDGLAAAVNSLPH